MKRAEKETMKAGIVHYLRRMVRNEENTLRGMREAMHQRRNGKETWAYMLTDWDAFYSLAKTQVLMVRRARIALEAAELWNDMRTNCLVISSPKVNGDGRRINENDPRWSEVTDNTLVIWDGGEGEPAAARWGDLTMQDRKTVAMQPNGQLVGGYPF